MVVVSWRWSCSPLGRAGPRSCQATQPTSPFADRRGWVPTVASRNAPVPYVHLASPGARQASANSAACWSTASPHTGSSRPNAVVVPTVSAQVATAGSVAGVDAERVARLVGPGGGVEVEEEPPRRGGGVGHERAAQPVQDPGVGRRGDAVGRDVLAQPGDLGCGEVRVELEPGDLGEPGVPSVARESLADDGRTPVLPAERGRQRGAGGAVPAEHGLALVGQRDRVDDGALRSREQRQRAGVDDRAPQLLGILFDAAAVERDRVHGHLAHAKHPTIVADDEGLGRGRPLVEGEDDSHGIAVIGPAPIRPGSGRRPGRRPGRARRRRGSTRRTPRPRPRARARRCPRAGTRTRGDRFTRNP